MKISTVLFILMIVLYLTACNGSVKEESPTIKSNDNPLVGAWLLIEGKYYTADRDTLYGEFNKPEQPSQIKVFSNNHFAYISRGDNGLNTAGSAGLYRVEGNNYIETHEWPSMEIAKGATSTYEFRILGDTLFMSGPIKSVFSNGKSWDDHIQMDEVRIRAK